MEVTGVEINPLRTRDEYYKAVATIYLGDYAVNGILISEREGKIKIRFPFVAQKGRKDGHRTFAFAPLSSAARSEIEQAICKAYWERGWEENFLKGFGAGNPRTL